MKGLYVDAIISGTVAATPLDAQAGANDDRVLRKIVVGKPVAGASITVFSINNALATNTTQIALKYTFPTFSGGTPASDTITLTAGSGEGGSKRDGLLLNSGSVATSSAMQVTFLYDDPSS